ncbi:MAG: hypothetical protein RB191_24965 [Terriglobia bacterium]|nr:hypothetical protein [Terriglobia bacterium]
MRIVIDYIVDIRTGDIVGEQVVDTDQTALFAHPTIADTQITFHELLQLLDCDVTLRTRTGWNESQQLEGEASPKTRWQRLVEHTDSNEGDPRLKALGLKY